MIAVDVNEQSLFIPTLYAGAKLAYRYKAVHKLQTQMAFSK